MEVIDDDADDAPAVGGAGSRGSTASEVILVDDHSVASEGAAVGGDSGPPGAAPASDLAAPADGGGDGVPGGGVLVRADLGPASF
eukprot:12320418-Alexandrium_andersonii.AAC.1